MSQIGRRDLEYERGGRKIGEGKREGNGAVEGDRGKKEGTMKTMKQEKSEEGERGKEELREEICRQK